jgi:hypothetical protein
MHVVLYWLILWAVRQCLVCWPVYLPVCRESPASARTHWDSTEIFDHSTITQVAAFSSLSMTLSNVFC